MEVAEHAARYPAAVRVGRKVPRPLRQHRLVFLAVLALLALALGTTDFETPGNRSSIPSTGRSPCWRSISSSRTRSRSRPRSKWLVSWSQRWLPPTFTALIVVLQDEWHLIRARFTNDHVVVCGLGRRGMRLVRPPSLREPEPQLVKVAGGGTEPRPVPPKRVVAIEADHSNPNVDVARRLGAVVLIGDSTEPDLVHAAGVQRATTLISVLPEDAHNAAVASVAGEFAAPARIHSRPFATSRTWTSWMT